MHCPYTVYNGATHDLETFILVNFSNFIISISKSDRPNFGKHATPLHVVAHGLSFVCLELAYLPTSDIGQILTVCPQHVIVISHSTMSGFKSPC